MKQKRLECVLGKNVALLGHSSSDFAMHEIDYVFAARKNVAVRPNASEVAECAFVDEDAIEDFVAKRPVYPWMNLIRRNADGLSFFR